MMKFSAARWLAAAFGAIKGALTPTQTDPIEGQGILNQDDLDTTPKLVLAGKAEGKTLRCKLVVVTAGANVAWATVERDKAAPVITAGITGAAAVGSLVLGGGGIVEHFSIEDTCDLYLVASAASTVINLTVVEA